MMYSLPIFEFKVPLTCSTFTDRCHSSILPIALSYLHSMILYSTYTFSPYHGFVLLNFDQHTFTSRYWYYIIYIYIPSPLSIDKRCRFRIDIFVDSFYISVIDTTILNKNLEQPKQFQMFRLTLT